MPTITRAEAFSILQVSEGADEAQLKTAWKKLALIHHPDKNGEQLACRYPPCLITSFPDPTHRGAGGSDEAKQRFQEINAAYEKLSKNIPDDEDYEFGSNEEAMDELRTMFESEHCFRFAINRAVHAKRFACDCYSQLCVRAVQPAHLQPLILVAVLFRASMFGGGRGASQWPSSPRALNMS